MRDFSGSAAELEQVRECAIVSAIREYHDMSDSDASQKSAPVVIIADADPDIRELAGHFLTEAGYKVEYGFEPSRCEVSATG